MNVWLYFNCVLELMALHLTKFVDLSSWVALVSEMSFVLLVRCILSELYLFFVVVLLCHY